MNRVIYLEFGRIELLEDYLIIEFNEGVIFNAAINETIISIVEAHFGDRSFGYITNRVNSYSVDPTIYHRSSSVKNLKSIAIVSHTDTNRVTAGLERIFCKKPFEIFDNLLDAKEWTRSMLVDQRITA